MLCCGMGAICVMLWDVCNMCYVMGCVQYVLCYGIYACIHSIYIYAMLWDMCNAVGLIWLRCIVLLLFVFVIVAVKAFMAQLQCPRQISLNGTIKFIVSYRTSLRTFGLAQTVRDSNASCVVHAFAQHSTLVDMA